MFHQGEKKAVVEAKQTLDKAKDRDLDELLTDLLERCYPTLRIQKS